MNTPKAVMAIQNRDRKQLPDRTKDGSRASTSKVSSEQRSGCSFWYKQHAER